MQGAIVHQKEKRSIKGGWGNRNEVHQELHPREREVEIIDNIWNGKRIKSTSNKCYCRCWNENNVFESVSCVFICMFNG